MAALVTLVQGIEHRLLQRCAGVWRKQQRPCVREAAVIELQREPQVTKDGLDQCTQLAKGVCQRRSKLWRRQEDQALHLRQQRVRTDSSLRAVHGVQRVQLAQRLANVERARRVSYETHLILRSDLAAHVLVQQVATEPIGAQRHGRGRNAVEVMQRDTNATAVRGQPAPEHVSDARIVVDLPERIEAHEARNEHDVMAHVRGFHSVKGRARGRCEQ
jgi:hypothetical protein